jgi:hypothetical protein
MVNTAYFCTRRGLVYASLLALFVTTALPSDARPDSDKVRSKTYKTLTGAYGVVELSQSGRPFFRTFFSRGWPTTKTVKDLTLHDSQGSAEDGLLGLMASGMGIKLNESTYIDYLKRAGLKKGGRTWSRSSDVISDKLTEFSTLAGLEKSKQFTPIVLEYAQGTPKIKGSFDVDKLSSQSWVNTGVDTKNLSMDAICMSLYSQALYARQQLVDSKHLIAPQKYNFGDDSDHAFYGLLSLQLALAKVHEIKTRGIVFKKKLGVYKGMANYGLTGNKAWMPHRIKVKRRGASLSFLADTKNDAYQSQLFDQSIMLLGCTELLKMVRWAQKGARPASPNEKLLTTLFRSKRFDDYENTPIDPKSFDMVLDMALFVVTNLQRLHFDVDRRTFRSRSSDNPEGERVQSLSAVDAGLTLFALSSFLKELAELSKDIPKSDSSLKARFIRKQRLAKTQLKLLTRWFCRLIERKGFVDRYNIATQAALDKSYSAASLAFTVRGFLSLKGLSTSEIPAAEREIAESAAMRLLKNAEKKLWNPKYQLYIGRTLTKTPSKSKPYKIDSFGQIAMLGAMRMLANYKNDVRYLIRYGEVMNSLKKHGFLNAETERGGDKGGDSDKDGVLTPNAAKDAPVMLPEVFLTK